jgi:hypothetical protein
MQLAFDPAAAAHFGSQPAGAWEAQRTAMAMAPGALGGQWQPQQQQQLLQPWAMQEPSAGLQQQWAPQAQGFEANAMHMPAMQAPWDPPPGQQWAPQAPWDPPAQWGPQAQWDPQLAGLPMQQPELQPQQWVPSGQPRLYDAQQRWQELATQQPGWGGPPPPPAGYDPAGMPGPQGMMGMAGQAQPGGLRPYQPGQPWQMHAPQHAPQHHPQHYPQQQLPGDAPLGQLVDQMLGLAGPGAEAQRDARRHSRAHVREATALADSAAAAAAAPPQPAEVEGCLLPPGVVLPRNVPPGVSALFGPLYTKPAPPNVLSVTVDRTDPLQVGGGRGWVEVGVWGERGMKGRGVEGVVECLGRELRSGGASCPAKPLPL